MNGPGDNSFGFPPKNTENPQENNIKKLSGIMDPLNRVKFNLRRQESEDGSSVIDGAKFSAAVSALGTALEQKNLSMEDISNALGRVANIIKETGELPKIGRGDVDRMIDNMKRVISSLRVAGEEIQSLSSLRENPAISPSLVRLHGALQDKVSTLVRAAGKLKDYGGR